MPNVPPDWVSVEVPLWTLGVRSVPTSLVTRNGRIEKAWVAALSRDEERKAVTDELLKIGRDANRRSQAFDKPVGKVLPSMDVTLRRVAHCGAS